MLVESPAGLFAVRLGPIALRLGCAMGQPPFSGAIFGLLACYALARDPQIDDVSHCKARPGRMPEHKRANCADTVATTDAARISPYQNVAGAEVGQHTVQ